MFTPSDGTYSVQVGLSCSSTTGAGLFCGLGYGSPGKTEGLCSRVLYHWVVSPVTGNLSCILRGKLMAIPRKQYKDRQLRQGIYASH
jgi:hypothetical protein